jgi:hypothetical protein
MMAAGNPDRQAQAGEYLHLLQGLTAEIERAMQAITDNALPDLEESVANQQMLSEQIDVLVRKLSVPLETGARMRRAAGDDGLRSQIVSANERLQMLNRGYAALLQHSSRSIALMASLFASFRGQIQEASGTRAKVQTWSCQM